jgi:hypothetical protein
MRYQTDNFMRQIAMIASYLRSLKTGFVPPLIVIIFSSSCLFSSIAGAEVCSTIWMPDDKEKKSVTATFTLEILEPHFNEDQLNFNNDIDKGTSLNIPRNLRSWEAHKVGRDITNFKIAPRGRNWSSLSKVIRAYHFDDGPKSLTNDDMRPVSLVLFNYSLNSRFMLVGLYFGKTNPALFESRPIRGAVRGTNKKGRLQVFGFCLASGEQFQDLTDAEYRELIVASLDMDLS